MKHSRNSFIYYIAFILFASLRLCNSSTIINFPLAFNYSIIMLCLVLFVLKIMLDNHTIKEYLILLFLTVFFVYIYYTTKNIDFLIGLVAIVAIKNVNIKNVIKIDIFVKLFFLLTHGLLYLSDYLFNYDAIKNFIIISSKGTSHALYFSNPNTVGALSLLLVLDFLMLKKDIKKFDLLVGMAVVLFSYVICKSRTALLIYVVFMGLYWIKNMKIMNGFSKYSYFGLALISFIIVNYIDKSNSLLLTFNKLFSNRLIYSIAAYKHYGLSMLPTSSANNFIEIFTIDNFYVRCFINYGVIALLLTGIISMKIPKEGFKMEKAVFIVACFYLFFEAVIINIGFAVPFLIMGSISIYKQGIEEKNER